MISYSICFILPDISLSIIPAKSIHDVANGNATVYIYVHFYMFIWGFPGGTSGKEPACRCRRHKRLRSDPWVRNNPWRRAWQPTPVFLPGESHAQRSLAGYSPWGRKDSGTTERPTLSNGGQVARAELGANRPHGPLWKASS